MSQWRRRIAPAKAAGAARDRRVQDTRTAIATAQGNSPGERLSWHLCEAHHVEQTPSRLG
jgi:hypothetical protein